MTRWYVKYNGTKLSPGDIVDLNGNGTPYIYEGLEDKTNHWPLCADNVDALTRYTSCVDFLEGNSRENEVVRHDYPEKDYSTTNIPVTGYDKIYLNPFEEIKAGDVVELNGKKFIRTGFQGTATHVLSAIPAKTTTSSNGFNLPIITGGSTDNVTDAQTDTTSPEPDQGSGPGPVDDTDNTPTPTPSPSRQITAPSPSITPTPSTSPPTVTPTPSTSPPSNTGGGY
tara:strand:+ start:316 stop:993 length:678 start_codon:yes stop_codon:yes gene_type:complete